MNRAALILCLPVALAACGKKQGDAPTGQVVATVDGKEVTASELRMELGEVARDPAQAAKQQPAALQTLINRRLLAEAAEERGLDKTPEGVMALQKARELALIQMMENSIVKQAPKVGVDQAKSYANDNPAFFSQRRLVSVDQIVVPQIQPALLKQLQPLNTLEQIVTLLNASKTQYRTGTNLIDPVTADPRAASQILAMSAGSVFLTPVGQGVQVSRINGFKNAPLTGDEATNAALAVLGQQQMMGQVRQQFEQILKAGQPKVKVNASYQNKAQPAGARRDTQ
jgi:EpsD family peptidyl-prolyl cis-trans isomerase